MATLVSKSFGSNLVLIHTIEFEQQQPAQNVTEFNEELGLYRQERSNVIAFKYFLSLGAGDECGVLVYVSGMKIVKWYN